MEENLRVRFVTINGMMRLTMDFSSYPAAVRMHVHHTKVYVPLDIARALYANPALVQKPVESFYTRDAFQLRVSSSTRCHLLVDAHYISIGCA